MNPQLKEDLRLIKDGFYFGVNIIVLGVLIYGILLAGEQPYLDQINSIQTLPDGKYILAFFLLTFYVAIVLLATRIINGFFKFYNEIKQTKD